MINTCNNYECTHCDTEKEECKLQAIEIQFEPLMIDGKEKYLPVCQSWNDVDLAQYEDKI